METPQINSALVYSTIADLMPQEGKDFKLDTEYGENNKPKLVITPMSPIGRAWIPFLRDKLSEPLAKDGFDIVEGGNVAAEVETVNSIRRHIENDAAEALRAKIRAAEEAAKAKQATADDLRKEQVKAEGEDARPNKAVTAASDAASAAYKEHYRLTQIANRIQHLREVIDRDAVNAANEDAKHGRIWAVDMDAPLISLFDRQDVQRKLRGKENMLRQMAEYSHRLEELKLECVNVAKQYIIQKEG